MKKLILICFCLSLGLEIATAQNLPPKVTLENFPEPAQRFLRTYFSTITVAYSFSEERYGALFFRVKYSDGTDVRFYENGEWQRVKMHYKTVPDGILPPKIKQYMQNSPYRKVAIKEIERKPYGFELELLSDIEILFDHEGNFLGLDD